MKYLGRTTNIKSIDKEKCNCISTGKCLPDCASFDQEVFEDYRLKVGSWEWAVIKMLEGSTVINPALGRDSGLYMKNYLIKKVTKLLTPMANCLTGGYEWKMELFKGFKEGRIIDKEWTITDYFKEMEKYSE